MKLPKVRIPSQRQLMAMAAAAVVTALPLREAGWTAFQPPEWLRPWPWVLVTGLMSAAISLGMALAISRCRRHERMSQGKRIGQLPAAIRRNRDLQTSRERLVLAWEAERRRLRSELHDGLEAGFAGMSMQLHAAMRLQPDDRRQPAILGALAADLASCTGQVRRLAQELRPPALDRGLAAAVRAECRRFATEALSVHCEVDDSLDELPAALEVTAFQIVAAALTNVAQHSRAATCHVQLRRTAAAGVEMLWVEIIDDGVGFDSRVAAEVGLRAMAERAAELGGACHTELRPGGGTSVRLELPLPAQPDER